MLLIDFGHNRELLFEEHVTDRFSVRFPSIICVHEHKHVSKYTIKDLLQGVLFVYKLACSSRVHLLDDLRVMNVSYQQ